MKLFKKAVLTVLFLSFASLSFAQDDSFLSFAAQVDSFIEDTKGVIVEGGKEPSVDLGKSSGIFKGCVLNIFRDGEELLHPVTGSSLGKKRIHVGTLKIKETYDKYSVGSPSLNQGQAIKKGDNIGLEIPLPVQITFIGLDDKITAEAKYSLMQSGLIQESDESPYSITCSIKKEGSNSFAECVFAFDKIVISQAEIPLMLPVVTTASSTVKISSGKTLSKEFEHSLDKPFTSVSIGKFFGKDHPLGIALSDGKKIYLYEIGNKILKEISVIDGDFNNIINIEAADLNNNGVYEIFVSNIARKGGVSSSIYEFDGSRFVQMKKDIKLLFRSFFTNGSKKIIAQAFADGDFAGMIYTYSYLDTGYEVYETFEKSYGAKLYGFAYGAFGGRNDTYTINFDGTGNLTFISSDGENKFVLGKEFGYTPHRLVYSKTLIKGMEKDNQGALINVFDTKKYGFPVYQRIIELESSPSKFYMLVNDVDRRRNGAVDFLNSYSGIYMFIRSEALPLLKMQKSNRAALEADIIYSPDDKYIAVLNQEGESGIAFKTDKSIVEIYSLSR